MTDQPTEPAAQPEPAARTESGTAAPESPRRSRLGAGGWRSRQVLVPAAALVIGVVLGAGAAGAAAFEGGHGGDRHRGEQSRGDQSNRDGSNRAGSNRDEAYDGRDRHGDEGNRRGNDGDRDDQPAPSATPSATVTPSTPAPTQSTPSTPGPTPS
ncbi:MAG: hypothetical protein QOD41_4556 [Cryptosporangiaceae bacterium]|nr:hypothetical protein [Cryptosporangiaceae bacterium]